jgi:hypothetical protein
MSYQAQCHCGAVQLAVEGELPEKAVTCNCSLCSAKGLVLAAVARDQLEVTAGEESLTTYKFNRGAIAHRFCSECGTQTFSEGKGADGSGMAMVNLRCVAAADLDQIELIHYDGASL